MAELPSYTSLYRRFRPQRFSEVLGQEHVTKALQNAVSQDRASHAYLFSGPRGTGKTSTARILAKALNCHAPLEGEPCCECASCVSIAEGRSFDVVELDAASNSGVEAIRSLISQAPTGTMGKWKVYIIDEVHMLSTPASNALLKTLEEPPSHVIFVLATTDPQKVLPTIKSRTQHYEFRFLDEATLEELIKSVKERADLNFGEEAFSWLVDKGGGSARDTLSYLDQIVALGYIPESRGDLELVIQALEAKDVKGVMAGLDSCLRSGQDPQRICTDLIGVFRTLFLDSLGTSDGPSGAVKRSFSSQLLVRALSVLGETLGDMKDSLDPRIILEVSLVRLIDPDPDPLLAGLSQRVSQLEKEVSLLKAHESSSSGFAKAAAAVPDTIRDEEVSSRAQPRPKLSPGTSQMRDKISEAPSPPQGRSKDDMAKLKSVLSGAKAVGNVAGEAAVAAETTPAFQSDTADPGSPETASAAKEASRQEASAAHSGDEIGGSRLPVDLEQGNRIFKKEILPLLSPRARSLYSAASLVALDPLKVVLSVPNEAHRSHAMVSLGDVSKAFTKYFSNGDLVVELTSDEQLGVTPSAPVPEVDSSAELIEQFSSAPEAAGGGVESQILEMFPGAKKIEG
ncbi:MAG: DNA polymerase III subunit gamma/tau [Actinomycetota bacterium]|nr:DNA polymerase III subunit gamma/tau [Actinomycetota bacterium]